MKAKRSGDLFKASFYSNTSPNNDARRNSLVRQGASKVLLDVRVHDRPEVEVLDVSEQVDDEHLAETPGSLEASGLSPALNRTLASSRKGRLSVLYLVIPVGVKVWFPS